MFSSPAGGGSLQDRGGGGRDADERGDSKARRVGDGVQTLDGCSDNEGPLSDNNMDTSDPLDLLEFKCTSSPTISDSEISDVRDVPDVPDGLEAKMMSPSNASASAELTCFEGDAGAAGQIGYRQGGFHSSPEAESHIFPPSHGGSSCEPCESSSSDGLRSDLPNYSDGASCESSANHDSSCELDEVIRQGDPLHAHSLPALLCSVLPRDALLDPVCSYIYNVDCTDEMLSMTCQYAMENGMQGLHGLLTKLVDEAVYRDLTVPQLEREVQLLESILSASQSRLSVCSSLSLLESCKRSLSLLVSLLPISLSLTSHSITVNFTDLLIFDYCYSVRYEMTDGDLCGMVDKSGTGGTTGVEGTFANEAGKADKWISRHQGALKPSSLGEVCSLGSSYFLSVYSICSCLTRLKSFCSLTVDPLVKGEDFDYLVLQIATSAAEIKVGFKCEEIVEIDAVWRDGEIVEVGKGTNFQTVVEETFGR